MKGPVLLDDVVGSRWPSSLRVREQQRAIDANVTHRVVSFVLHKTCLVNEAGVKNVSKC